MGLDFGRFTKVLTFLSALLPSVVSFLRLKSFFRLLLKKVTTKNAQPKIDEKWPPNANLEVSYQSKM